MSYDALVLDDELKDALQNVMGKELEAEKLQGYTLQTHAGTGIQYLVREDVISSQRMEDIRMNIGGVTTNYSAAYDTEKVQNAGIDKNFAEEIANAAQTKGTEETSAARGSDEESEDTAVFRVLYTDSGIKYTVYKTKDFSPENPIYKVKIWDEEDNMTERMIDVSKINPRNCDTFEMEVYAAHLKETGKGDFVSSVLSAAIAKAASQANQKSTVSWDYSTRINWVDAVKYVMQSAYNYGDFKGYMEWKKFLSFLE